MEKKLKKLANFTLHDQSHYVSAWRDMGYEIDPMPRAPLIEFQKCTWTENKILRETYVRIKQIRDEGFDAVLIGGLSNCMAYAWYIARSFQMEVLMARTPRVRDELTGKPLFILTGYSKLLDPSEIAVFMLREQYSSK